MSGTPGAGPTEPLHAYLDGELSPEDAAAVEARLQADAAARVLLTSLSVQRDALHATFKLPSDCPKTKAMIALVFRHQHLVPKC